MKTGITIAIAAAFLLGVATSHVRTTRADIPTHVWIVPVKVIGSDSPTTKDLPSGHHVAGVSCIQEAKDTICYVATTLQ
jgi:hypothetical protein